MNLSIISLILIICYFMLIVCFVLFCIVIFSIFGIISSTGLMIIGISLCNDHLFHIHLYILLNIIILMNVMNVVVLVLAFILI